MLTWCPRLGFVLPGLLGVLYIVSDDVDVVLWSAGLGFVLQHLRVKIYKSVISKHNGLKKWHVSRCYVDLELAIYPVRDGLSL